MPKRLVVCCDGTWNNPDQQSNGIPCPTNVTKVALSVPAAGADGVKQLVFYDKGVGNNWYSKLGGGAFGIGLSKNIEDAYRFLIANYEPDDALYFFGFSRGAYTVRSLAGLIRNSGLLRKEFESKVEAAYDLYRRRDKASHPRTVEATLFRRSFSHEPGIRFLGVWDTVGALGIPVPGPFRVINKYWEFHDVKLSRSVENAFHAIAIDEKRKAFAPTLWEQQAGAGNQVLQQVWFAGVHSNIGGGYAQTGLSDIALLWMTSKAEGCGLTLDFSRLNENLRPKPNPAEAPQNSQRWFYKLIGFGDYLRPIGKDDDGKPRDSGVNDDGSPRISCESAAKTAVDKLNAPNSHYKAKNLRDFIAAGGPISPDA